MAAKRFAVVLGAVVAFQMYIVTAATPLASTGVLAPAAPEAATIALPARPPTVAVAATRIGNGWAKPVARAAANYAYQYRTRYGALIEPAQPQESVVAAAVVGPAKALLADVEVLVPPPPVTAHFAGLTVVDDPSSRFQLEMDTRQRVVRVSVADLPGVGFEIDYRDRASDIHRIGVTPILLGHRLEGNFLRSRGELTFPLVTPTFDAGRVTHTTIANEDDALTIRFEGGPYSNLLPGREADGATYLEVRIAVTDKRVRMDLAGLYYVRPAVGAEMFFTTDSTTTAITVGAGTPSILKYIENPTRVDISDPAYGDYLMRTDVSRLQVQWDGVGTAFELDFDHAYKDRGQVNVQSRLVFATPSET